jgi:hypothetical protein
MKKWLEENYDKIGHEDTVDLHSEFLYSISRVFDEKIEAINHKNKPKKPKNKSSKT